MCKKASQKLNTFAGISNYLDIQKRRTIMKYFTTSQFSYCSLFRMSHSRSLNNKVNSIHERALGIAYADKTSTFQQLLEPDNSVSIHHKNLHVLATEICKISNNLSPEFLTEIFEKRANLYNFQSNTTFRRRQVNSVYQVKIKNWILCQCSCRMCRTYLPQIVFI